MRCLRPGVVLALVLVALPQPARASTVVIDFESLTDLETITTQFPGVTFSNAVALTAGISLNEFEFPPASGSNVASDDVGPMSVVFAAPVTLFGGRFTYLTPLILHAFDSTNTLLGSVSSSFSSNLALPGSGDPGSSPNELLVLAFSDISRVTITGDPLGGSFTVDDVSYTQTVVPEPGTMGLLLVGAAGLRVVRRRA